MNTSVRSIAESTAEKIPGSGAFWAFVRVNADKAVR
jgi:hypothetical protein